MHELRQQGRYQPWECGWAGQGIAVGEIRDNCNRTTRGKKRSCMNELWTWTLVWRLTERVKYGQSGGGGKGK